MLKKILLLMLSVNMLVATTNNPIDEDLTERQRTYVRCFLLMDSLVFGATFGSLAVSYLPAGSSLGVKAAIFIPITSCLTAMMSSNSREKWMIHSYKKHRQLLLGI